MPKRSAHTLSVTDLESASGYTLTKVTYTLPGGSATELTVTGSAMIPICRESPDFGSRRMGRFWIPASS